MPTRARSSPSWMEWMPKPKTRYSKNSILCLCSTANQLACSLVKNINFLSNMRNQNQNPNLNLNLRYTTLPHPLPHPPAEAWSIFSVVVPQLPPLPLPLPAVVVIFLMTYLVG